jgi:hypothetical protein
MDYLPRVLFFNAFELDAVIWKDAYVGTIKELKAKALMRVNSVNVLVEGLRIGEIGHRMNSKVKAVKQGVYRK